MKEDDDAREKKQTESGDANNATTALLFDSYSEVEKKRQLQFSKERDQMVKNTELFFRQKRKVKRKSSFVTSDSSGLKDEYVNPMFEVTWGPCLSAFAIAMENANGADKKKFNKTTESEK